ncbi:hypothetical protein [Mucilaginibacter lacusdianchii]|uniref:hypothetical protein n=1 Tax=Mucilaginibacter lacusdianchii TaxID=2684211 RepID=UPI00131E08AA|nr:hypothetical protein [Mucilaginibacter sp. JXJ CY 39]
MAVKFLKYRWQKCIAVILCILIAIVLIAAVFVNRYWSPILADKVKSTVLAGTDSLYEAEFKDAEFHVLQGKLVIYNITIKPNMAVYQRTVKNQIAPNNLYELKVKKLVIRRMHPIKLYFHNKLDIGQIILSAPELQVTYRLNHTRDTLIKDKRNAWQRIRPLLKSIHIGQVMLNDVKFKYNDYSGNKLDISELKEMNLTCNDLLIDSTTQNNISRFYYFNEVQFELNNFSRPSNNGLYKYHVNLLQFSTLTSRLQAYGVRVAPVEETIFIDRKVRNQFAFYTDTLQIDNFDFKAYNKYRIFNSSKIVFDHGDFNVTTIPGAVPQKRNRLLSFPNVAIFQLKNTFKIDTVQLRHFNITYQGYGKKSHKQGHISFNNTNGTILNVSNNLAFLQQNNVCRMQFNSKIMNAGLLDANVTFNLTDSAKTYAYKGTLGPMNLEKFNSVSMPFALVKIASGKLNHFSFDVTGNRNEAHGHVTFLYNDLRIRILKNDSTRYKKRPIVSLMANALILKHNNPDKPGDVPRSVEVSYIRQPDTPFFKTIWKTLAQGIKASAGYDAATEKQVKQHIKQFTLDKKNRQARKAARQKRREQQHKRSARH